MKQKPPAEARSVGDYLSDPRFSARRLLTEAERLTQLQIFLCEWAPASLRPFLHIAAEREGELVIHTSSAAALTEIRYRQSELLDYLRRHFDLSATKVVTKIVPTA